MLNHLKRSLQNMKRNGWMTIAALSSISVTLLLVGAFFGLVTNINHLSDQVANNVRIVTYLDTNTHDQEKTFKDKNKKDVLNGNFQKIQNEIKDINGVKSVKYSSKAEQLKMLETSLGESWKQFNGDANPLYDAYIVEASSSDNVKKVATEIGKIKGVQRATYGGQNTTKLFKLVNEIRVVGVITMALLLAISMFLISNTIRITINARQNEIKIMKWTGASDDYIKWPFIFEGMWIGVIGTIIPSALLTFIYSIIEQSNQSGMAIQGLQLYSTGQFALGTVITLAVIGIVIGISGSLVAMRRFLDV